MNNPNIRNIFLDILLTMITCGLFNFYVQYRQIETVNDMLGERKYDFLFWILFCFCTCGLYHIYHEYKKSKDIAKKLGKDPETAGLIAVILTILASWWINDAIQQSEINEFYKRGKV